MDQQLPSILTPKDVMKLLQISPSTFYRYIKTGYIPYRKMDSRVIRIIRDELLEKLKMK